MNAPRPSHPLPRPPRALPTLHSRLRFVSRGSSFGLGRPGLELGLAGLPVRTITERPALDPLLLPRLKDAPVEALVGIAAGLQAMRLPKGGGCVGELCQGIKGLGLAIRSLGPRRRQLLGNLRTSQTDRHVSALGFRVYLGVSGRIMTRCKRQI